MCIPHVLMSMKCTSFFIKLFSVLLLCLLSGCVTRHKPDPVSVSYPTRLNAMLAQEAVVCAYQGTIDRSKSSFKYADFGFGGTASVKTAEMTWYVHDIGENYVTLTFEKKRYHRLYVRIDFLDDKAVLSISGSENLSESDNRIHKNVRVWMRDVQSEVTRIFGIASSVLYLEGQKK